mgnify:CR=1 FL=1
MSVGCRAVLNGPTLSVVVVFHNMRREARRTLFSLTPRYQIGVSADAYEVIAVDSGSSERLDPEEVAAFGPQFRYKFVHAPVPSPALALNQAACDARGDVIMSVIDGARILSPGILAKTFSAFRTYPEAFVLTLGLHLGSEIQQVSIERGYDQRVEDALLNTVAWREDGYELFKISALAMSSGEGYRARLTESNCTAVRAENYWRLGGYDECFATRGGGLVNHDLFNRAMLDEALTPVMLLGEATFHQFHGGVSTNVRLEDHPFAEFANEYRHIRGREYAPVFREPVYFGQMVAQARHLLNEDRPS